VVEDVGHVICRQNGLVEFAARQANAELYARAERARRLDDDISFEVARQRETPADECL